MAEGKAELKVRTEADATLVPLDEVVGKITAIVRASS